MDTFNPCHDPIFLVDRWRNGVTEKSVTCPRPHKHYVRIILRTQVIQLQNLNHSTVLTLVKGCLLGPVTMLNSHSYKSWKQVSITNVTCLRRFLVTLIGLHHGWPGRLQLTILSLPITEWVFVLQSQGHSFPLHPCTSQSLNKKTHSHSLTHIFI